MSEDRIETAILQLVELRGAGKSICPSEAAREAFGEDWKGHMRHVRSAAIHLARQRRITILRKGKPADPDNFKGVYRLALPADAGPPGRSEQAGQTRQADEAQDPAAGPDAGDG